MRIIATESVHSVCNVSPNAGASVRLLGGNRAPFVSFNEALGDMDVPKIESIPSVSGAISSRSNRIGSALLAISLAVALSGCGGGGDGEVGASNGNAGTEISNPIGKPNPEEQSKAPTSLAYSDTAPQYLVGIPIQSNTPSSGGGAIERYSVTPALPFGLSLDTRTGMITGTPARVSPVGTYSVTASNSAGSVQTNLQIAVVALGQWELTGSTAEQHGTHVSALLPNGLVLVAGGGTWPVPSAELYDPASRKWSPTAGMAVWRSDGFTATSLVDGRVLVAGNGAPDARSEAEIYNPATGEWTFTGPMGRNRFGHTATLLRNGQVLVTGGFSGAAGYEASAMLYDPTTNKWSSTGSMTSARQHHTATLLPDGKVLVAGGVGADNTSQSSAEVYDPAVGTWSSVKDMAAARAKHTATLLGNGQVLIAGSGAELYDPASGMWTAAGLMLTRRTEHTATLLPDGRVLVAGGFNGSGPALSSSEVYDPMSNKWLQTGPLNAERLAHTATLLNEGTVLVVGGRVMTVGAAPIKSAEIYTPATGH